MPDLSSRYIETKRVKWREIKDFQPETFKSMSTSAAKRYVASIDKLGLIRNFKVFELEGEIYHLDGHHLAKAIKYGEAEKLFRKKGKKIPDLLPADFYQVKNRKEATEIILAHSSTYARVTYEGLDEFATLNDLGIDDVKEIAEIPAISFSYWEDTEPPTTEETDQEGNLSSLMKGADRYKVKKAKISFAVEPSEYGLLMSAIRRIQKRHEFSDLVQVLRHLISLEEEIEQIDETDVL